MESYNLLHARNEIAHGNHMMLLSSGTFCFWVFYRDYADLDLLLSRSSEIAMRNELRIETIKLSTGNAEELQKSLINMDLEFADFIFACSCLEFEPHMLDDYIGQDIIASLQNQQLNIPEINMSLNLSKEIDAKIWEQWLLQNRSQDQIQYFDPDQA